MVLSRMGKNKECKTRKRGIVTAKNIPSFWGFFFLRSIGTKDPLSRPELAIRYPLYRSCQRSGWDCCINNKSRARRWGRGNYVDSIPIRRAYRNLRATCGHLRTGDRKCLADAQERSQVSQVSRRSVQMNVNCSVHCRPTVNTGNMLVITFYLRDTKPCPITNCTRAFFLLKTGCKDIF